MICHIVTSHFLVSLCKAVIDPGGRRGAGGGAAATQRLLPANQTHQAGTDLRAAKQSHSKQKSGNSHGCLCWFRNRSYGDGEALNISWAKATTAINHK